MDDNVKTTSVEEVSEEFMDSTLSEFDFSARKKFRKGQVEHGGLITDRDCEKELGQEIIDLMFYFYGLKEQNRKLRERCEKLEHDNNNLFNENLELKENAPPTNS